MDRPPLVVISFKKQLVAMHAHTGERVWTYELGLSAADGRLLVEHDRVFYVSSGYLFCLDYKTGAELWKVSVPNPLGSSPELLPFAGCLLLSNIGEVGSFAMTDGRLLWHDNFRGMGMGEGAMAAPGVSAQVDKTQS